MGSLSPAVPDSPAAASFSLILPLRAAGNHPRRTAAKAHSGARKGGLRSAPRNRVLIVGTIRELALYRAEVLRAHGFAVSVSHSEGEAFDAIRSCGFDVVVLSYTLSNDVVEEVAELVRQHCPECRLVTISDTRYHDAKIAPDANVLADDGPKALLEALRETLRRR
jgi:PleD family two-component response regulator